MTLKDFIKSPYLRPLTLIGEKAYQCSMPNYRKALFGSMARGFDTQGPCNIDPDDQNAKPGPLQAWKNVFQTPSWGCADYALHDNKAMLSMGGVLISTATALATNVVILTYTSALQTNLLATVGLAVATTATGVVAGPLIMAGALAVIGGTLGALYGGVLGMTQGIYEAQLHHFTKNKKSAAPPSSIPAPVDARAPRPDLLLKRIEGLTSEQRQDLVKKIKTAFADDFTAATTASEPEPNPTEPPAFEPTVINPLRIKSQRTS